MLKQLSNGGFPSKYGLGQSLLSFGADKRCSSKEGTQLIRESAQWAAFNPSSGSAKRKRSSVPLWTAMIHSAENVYMEYCDPKRDEWVRKILRVL
jgi:hypothetical protein